MRAETLDDRIPIITYHSIDDSGSIVSTAPALFRRQIATLSAAGYKALTLGELAEITRSGKWPSRKSVILTFDDGFENFYKEAAPVLKDHSFNATVFLVTGHCGGFNDWPGNPPKLPRSRLLTWNQIKELSSLGIEFGSHTVTHPDLTTLSPRLSGNEIERSRNVIEDAIGRKVVSFAYPFGRFTSCVRRSVEDVYSAACSTDLGRISQRSDLFSLRRIDAYYLSNPRALDALQSRWMDRYFSLRQVIRSVRSSFARSSSGALADAGSN